MSMRIRAVDCERCRASMRFTMIVAAGIWLLVAPGWAQDSGSVGGSEGGSDIDAKVKALQDQKKLLDAQTELLKSQQTLILQSLPKGTTTPLQGGITVEGDLKAPTEILVYEALNRIAHEIARQIKTRDPNGKHFWITTTASVDTILAYQTFLNQGNLLLGEYDRLLKEPSTEELAGAALLPLLPTAITGALSATADILAFFRTETKLSAVSTTIPDAAMASALARGFAQVYAQENPKPAIYYGSLFIPGLITTAKNPSIIKMISNIQKRAGEVQEKVDTFNAQSKDNQETNRYKERIPQFKSINDATQKMLADLYKSENGTSRLQELIKAELTVNILDDDSARILYISIVQAGGVNKITKNLFSGSRLSQSAGAVVTYNVFEMNGTIKASGTIGELYGFVEMKTKSSGSVLQTGYE